MPRTKLGTRPSRSWASLVQAGPPVTTFVRTISSGSAGTVRPPISTPREDTSWVSIGFVSMATTRPHFGHLKVAARVPSPGSCRSSKLICWSHSTHRNFIAEIRASTSCLVSGNTCQDPDREFLRGIVGGGPHAVPAHHVLDDPDELRSAVERYPDGATHGIARLWRRDRHREHGGRVAEDIAQLDIALHTGGEVEQQEVEFSPIDIAQQLP